MRNGTFFNRLHLLNVGDKVEITDVHGQTIAYKVYDKYYIEPENMEVLKQNNKDKKELTLITCNNKGDQRLVLKLYEE